MEYKYYNNWEFKRAMATTENDPFSGAIELSNYLDKYPADYTSYLYYISTLLCIGSFDKAKEILDFIERIVNSDVYSDCEKRASILKYSYFFSKLKYLCYKKDYENAYNLYLKNSNVVGIAEINRIVFYLKYKLGLISDEEIKDRDRLLYLDRQIVDYKESDFLYHSKKHCSDNPYKNGDDETEFSAGFPLEDVVEEIKKYIPSDKKLYPGFIDNMYLFKYDNCGIYKKGRINYIKVITFNDTKDLITMYPHIKGERFPYVDLNYMQADKYNNKTKVLSQIDKFNSKFGIK